MYEQKGHQRLRPHLFLPLSFEGGLEGVGSKSSSESNRPSSPPMFVVVVVNGLMVVRKVSRRRDLKG